ncbi:hypothetical protein KSP39_PZI002662 [Platanthera zijinensis]|uniref:Uncharacterized protein n=1 Tax=Platanthera zijinensis TaxID=2320716 RepID=A0AAP0GDW8_9ASPA
MVVEDSLPGGRRNRRYSTPFPAQDLHDCSRFRGLFHARRSPTTPSSTGEAHDPSKTPSSSMAARSSNLNGRSFAFIVAVAGFYRPFVLRPCEELFCAVFESETNSWTRFVSSLYDEFTHIYRNQVVFSNKSMHWLTHTCSYVLALDLRAQIWLKISLLEEIKAGWISWEDLSSRVRRIRVFGSDMESEGLCEGELGFN